MTVNFMDVPIASGQISWDFAHIWFEDTDDRIDCFGNVCQCCMPFVYVQISEFLHDSRLGFLADKNSGHGFDLSFMSQTERGSLLLTSSIAFTRPHHWFTCVQLTVSIPAEIVVPAFPYPFTTKAVVPEQRKEVWQLLLKTVAERSALICNKAPTFLQSNAVQVTHVWRLAVRAAQTFKFTLSPA